MPLWISVGLVGDMKCFTGYFIYVVAHFTAVNPAYYLRMKQLQATPQLLDAVADRIAKQYIQLGLELGLPFEKILQCQMNNRNNTLKIVREILGEWLKKNHKNKRASIDGLAEALLRSGCSVQPLVEYVEQASIERQTGRKFLWCK